MDYTLTPNSDGGADLDYRKSSDLYVNVHTSLAIEQGSWWLDRSFGLKKRSRLKNTPATARLLQQDCESALKWLLDTGRATVVTVTPMAVADRPTWLRMHCVVVAADGQQTTYDKFIEVV